MNAFDRSILLFLSEFHGQQPGLDAVLAQFQENNLLKGGLFLTVIWYLWFRASSRDQDHVLTRQKLFATICAMIAGIIVARLLADLLPFRVRPAYNAQLHLQLPADTEDKLATWSSFPSDHAVVWFTLAFGVLGLDRKLGALACVYALILSIGRVYAGIHHPTDIIAAAFIAGGVLWLLDRPSIRATIYIPVASLQERHPGPFYAAAFLATYEISNLFDEVRVMALPAWHMLQALR